MRFNNGRTVTKDRQIAVGIYLQQILEEKKQNIKKKGMKRNGV